MVGGAQEEKRRISWVRDRAGGKGMHTICVPAEPASKELLEWTSSARFMTKLCQVVAL